MRALVLAPHTDDAEIGCGGTIAKLVEDGWDATFFDFSTGTANREEATFAGTSLGADVRFGQFETRLFPSQRQEILDVMLALRNELRPDRVFVPSVHDCHQDHRTVREEALRVFKGVTVLGYQEPWNQEAISVQMIVRLTAEQWAKKEAALAFYESQNVRASFSLDAMRAMGVLCGYKAQAAYGEPFEVVRWYE